MCIKKSCPLPKCKGKIIVDDTTSAELQAIYIAIFMSFLHFQQLDSMSKRLYNIILFDMMHQHVLFAFGSTCQLCFQIWKSHVTSESSLQFWIIFFVTTTDVSETRRVTSTLASKSLLKIFAFWNKIQYFSVWSHINVRNSMFVYPHPINWELVEARYKKAPHSKGHFANMWRQKVCKADNKPV